MTEVELGLAVEKPFERASDESDIPDMSQPVDKGNSISVNNFEITSMSTSQASDIFSGPINSSGPSRLSLFRDSRFKPYSERDRQRLEEQNSRRAILAQKELLRCGLSLSPSCVPHFDDYRSDVGEVENIIGSKRRRDISISSCEDLNLNSPEDEEKPFLLISTDVAEKYAGKSNLDLVKEYMEAEDKLEELDNKINSTRLNNMLIRKTSWFDVEAEMEKIRVFRKEIEKLTEENNHLLVENQKLNSILSDPD
ncbi:hypothetical protein JTE90_007716 [Oedothorax gibbosus]|uniref:Uncharacterized protein n=1 Tax=Oedothorax gibbosus TaxID=931172 RepID=A0AAV6V6S0_9ARAC|nr:hypothetical protein JTE90_007716 [Oedothorax gibbosus]